MLEGARPENPDHRLFIVNNTFVNQRSSGTFVMMAAANTTPAVLRNNVFYGPGTITNQASAALSNNLSGGNPLFVNEGAYDYRLRGGSPAIDAGADPGSAGGQSLAPAYQYVHASCGETRSPSGAIDVGAFEFGNTGTRLGCAPSIGTGVAALANLAVNPEIVVGGKISIATVMLDNPAPPGGIVVALSTSNSSAASTALSVQINAGSAGASFPVTTGPVTAATAATLTASYNGVSKTAAITVNPPLTMTGVRIESVTSSSATITWTTNVPATTQVEYGATTAYGLASPLNSAIVASHRASLTGLALATTYHFRAVSLDAAGAPQVSDDYTFTTLPTRGGGFTKQRARE
jgi:hypothetical protein